GYSTLKQWIFQGKVRTTTTAGGHHRLSDAEVDRLLARQTPEKAPARRMKKAEAVIVAMSCRNRLRGYVEEVRVDGLLGQVRLRIGDQILTAVVTADALAELKFSRGDDAVALIKSTEVMVAREREAAPVPRPRARRRRSTQRAQRFRG